MLNKFWGSHFKYDWKLGVFLILLFGIPRFFIVLQSYIDRSYAVVMFVFVAMWFMPFILLSKQGRTAIGLRRPPKWWRLVPAFIVGALICFATVGLFTWLYGSSTENAFVYIGSNNPGSQIAGDERMVYFWIAAIPSMIFSPIGEEFLYRGVIHGSFVKRFGEMKASLFDSLAFALTHIAHFGIVYVSGVWKFLPLPALLWVVSMFLLSVILFRCKQYCSSIWGAVAGHAGFNFAMIYAIFFIII